MRQLGPVLNVVGFVIVIFSVSMLIPLSIAWYGNDPALFAFSAALGIAFFTGVLLWLLTRRFRRELQPRDGFLLVSSVWVILPAIASIPFLIYFHQVDIPLSFTEAYFESMSGLSTTGATVLMGLDYMPASINAWRGTLIWLGGMGILVLAVAILPLLGIGGHQVYKAETPGPLKDDRLTPRIAGTAKGLYAIYLGFSALCFVSFRLVGMSWLDAYVHMGSTMALGGFSSHDISLAWFNSVPVELVTMFFMLIAGISFSLHFIAFRQRSLKPYWQSFEAVLFVCIVLAAGLLISGFLLYSGTYDNWLTALRFGMFNTISVATTTGFASTDYLIWPVFAPVLMLLLSCFVSTAGSTGGGIKLVRAIILVKQARRELTNLVHPRAVYTLRVGGKVISNRVIFSVLAFMLMYMMSVLILSLILLLTGLDVVTAFSAIVACLNSTGPGLGAVGPTSNYAGMDALQTWVCSFAMLLGRLELFSVLVLFTPTFWRK